MVDVFLMGFFSFIVCCFSVVFVVVGDDVCLLICHCYCDSCEWFIFIL